MTNEMSAEEAVKILRFEQEQVEHRLDGCSDTQENRNIYEAFGMAIKALEAQPSEDCISRQAVIDFIIDNYGVGFNSLTNGIRDYLPSVTPQASEEDIHREREQAYMLGYEDASKKFRTEPCEDCISRQAVIDTIGNVPDYDDGMVFEALSHAQRDVALLPSVTPKYTDEEIDKAQAIEQAYVDKMVELAVEEIKRPKGKWISHREHCESLGVIPSGLGVYEWCSNCDCGIDAYEWHRNPYNYCPNCGAEMKEGGQDV